MHIYFESNHDRSPTCASLVFEASSAYEVLNDELERKAYAGAQCSTGKHVTERMA